jgi:hypothetical protein
MRTAKIRLPSRLLPCVLCRVTLHGKGFAVHFRGFAVHFELHGKALISCSESYAIESVRLHSPIAWLKFQFASPDWPQTNMVFPRFVRMC